MTTLEDVKEIIEMEGFDYTFTDYSDFEEVDNDEFQELREGYLGARDRLKSFLERHEE